MFRNGSPETRALSIAALSELEQAKQVRGMVHPHLRGYRNATTLVAASPPLATDERAFELPTPHILAHRAWVESELSRWSPRASSCSSAAPCGGHVVLVPLQSTLGNRDTSRY